MKNWVGRHGQMMRQFLLAGIFILCSFLSLLAQKAPAVEARAVLDCDATHPGSTIRAAVIAQIPSGYHINDHKPSHEYLIPTVLKMESSPQVAIQDVSYPPGKAVKFEFDDAPLSVYQGTLVIKAALKIAPKTQPGDYTLKGKFAYQACNDRACFPPTSVPVELSVKVVRSGAPVKHMNEDIFKRANVE